MLILNNNVMLINVILKMVLMEKYKDIMYYVMMNK